MKIYKGEIWTFTKTGSKWTVLMDVEAGDKNVVIRSVKENSPPWPLYYPSEWFFKEGSWEPEDKFAYYCRVILEEKEKNDEKD